MDTHVTGHSPPTWLEKRAVPPDSLDSSSVFTCAAQTIWTLGVVLVIFGFVSIAAPLASGLLFQMLIDVCLIAAGISWISFAFHSRHTGPVIWSTLTGMLAIAGGFVMINRPFVSLQYFTLALAWFFLATGLLKVVLALGLKPHRGWGWTFSNGVITVALGAMIASQWPLSGLWAIGTLLGVDLLLGGFALMRIASAATTLLKEIEESSLYEPRFPPEFDPTR